MIWGFFNFFTGCFTGSTRFSVDGMQIRRLLLFCKTFNLPPLLNQNPEHLSRDKIDRQLNGLDNTLTDYETVDKNFQEWVFKKQAGVLKFTEEQMNWLRMIKDYIAVSFHIEKDDFDLSPFNAKGGLGKMWQLFGEKTDEIINELNEVLAA